MASSKQVRTAVPPNHEARVVLDEARGRVLNELIPLVEAVIRAEPNGLTEAEVLGHWRLSMFGQGMIREAWTHFRYSTKALCAMIPKAEFGQVESLQSAHVPWMFADAVTDDALRL